jgi:hypothetical protein
LHVLKVIPQELVYVLVKIKLYRDNKPLWIHFEEQQKSQQAFASQHYRRIFKELRKSLKKYFIVLESVIQFGVRLS